MKTLQDYIKLAASATEGPWDIKKYQGEVDCIGPIRSDEYAGTSWIVAEDEDAQFIAASRTLGPQMAKALIEAEEALRAYHEKERLGYCSESSSYNLSDTPAAKALSQIQALNGGEHDKQR